MNKTSKEYEIMWEDQIYIWLVYLKMMGRMKPSWKTLQDIIQENFSNPARQVNIQIWKIREHHKDTLWEEQPQTHKCQIHQGWNEGKKR